MIQKIHPDEVPAGIIDDVAHVVGSAVTPLGRLPGGLDVGAFRVRIAGGPDAILKAWPHQRSNQLEEVLRTQRVVAHMRGIGYPTPACLGVGTTATHVWTVMEYIDAPPALELTPSIVEQLMEIAELQAGQATEGHDHWSYSYRVVTGRDFGDDLDPVLTKAIAEVPRYSPEVSVLVDRLRTICADVAPPREAPDMVHADFQPANVLVRDGVVVAVIDIGNAGSGTRATDLTTLRWHTFEDSLDGARKKLATRILDLIGWDWAAMIIATQVLTQLEFPIRNGWHGIIPAVIARSHRSLDELDALR